MPKHPERVSVWEATPPDILDEVLNFARITENDVLYDLGSGDGCVLVRAAELYGCRAVGLEITDKLITMTRKRAKKMKLKHLVSVRNQDMKKANFKDTTIAYMYLPDGAVKKMFPILKKRCKPGTKIVTLGSTHVSGNPRAELPQKILHMRLPDRFWKMRLWIV